MNLLMNIMKKFTLAAVLVLLSATAINATEVAYRLLIWMDSGAQSAYALSTKPKVTYDETFLTVSTTSVSTQYPAEDVWKFTLDKIEISGIEEILNEVPTMRIVGDEVMFTGCRPGSEVRMFNVNGQSLAVEQADVDGALQINISHLPHGIYVLSTESITYKIIK